MSLSILGVYPKRIQKLYDDGLRYSYLEAETKDFMTKMLLISLIVSLLFAFLADFTFRLVGPIVIIVAISVFVIMHVVFYSWLVLSGESKAQFVNSVLPDALRLVASNLRSGSTVDRALMQSAREEFGPLKDAIDNAGKEISTGKSEDEAFRGMSKNINSESFERAIDLIIHGIKSGGELAKILDKIADVFRNRMLLTKEMRSGVLMYAIFIFFVLGLGAPVLFAVSNYLVGVMSSGINQPSMELGEDLEIVGGPMFANTKSSSVSHEFMTIYFVIAMIASSITGSIILGQILSGKVRAGLKFIPILITMSLVLFFAVGHVLSAFIGGIMAG